MPTLDGQLRSLASSHRSRHRLATTFHRVHYLATTHNFGGKKSSDLSHPALDFAYARASQFPQTVDSAVCTSGKVRIMYSN